MSVKKVKGGYENVGAHGSHGKFKTKAGAEAQKAAMFANGFHTKAHRALFKEKLHKAVSDAFDEHMKEHGMDEEADHEHEE